MKVTELITDAYYLSDVVSRELETVSGSQIADGLKMLNRILAEKSAKGYDIPYYTPEFNINTVIGQEKYFIPNLIEIDTVTYNRDNIRYSAIEAKRKRYFGSARANNVETLPTLYHFERALGGGNLYFYYFPAEVYEVNITGKFSLGSFLECDDIADSLDVFYISYLEYAIAKRICDFNGITFLPQKMAELRERENDIFKVATPDMQVRKSSVFNEGSDTIDYAYANLGDGFIPTDW